MGRHNAPKRMTETDKGKNKNVCCDISTKPPIKKTYFFISTISPDPVIDFSTSLGLPEYLIEPAP
jgi:hypothetical protein